MKEKKKRLTLPYKRPENAQYEILKGIQNGLGISEIAEYRKVKRQSVYDVLSSLFKKGLIERVTKGVYNLTSKGTETLHQFVGLRYNLRQHNLHVKIKILESPKNWELKRNEFRQLPYFNKSIKLKNNEQDLFNYGKLQIKTTTKSIIIKLPILYAKDWENAIIQAMDILESSISKIESLLKIRLIKDYKANITFISQEYAKIQDALAKLYRNEGNRLYISGDDGKIWLITDFSFSTDETEFIHPNKATDDLDAISPMLNDLRKNPTTFSEVRETIKGMLAVQQASNQNVAKHQRVLDEMLITLKKIQEKLN